MVSITRAAPNEVLEAAKNAGEEIAETSEIPPTLAVIISCAARRNLLGTRAEVEFIKAKKAMGESVQIIGMHSYGEFFYDPKNKEFESFGNESLCILELRERDEKQDKRHPDYSEMNLPEALNSLEKTPAEDRRPIYSNLIKFAELLPKKIRLGVYAPIQAKAQTAALGDPSALPQDDRNVVGSCRVGIGSGRGT